MNWSDKPTVIVASGPSLCDEDIAQVRCAMDHVHVIVINDNWRLLPMAEVLYAADIGWWWQYHSYVRDHFAGESWACDERVLIATEGRAHIVPSIVGVGLPEDGKTIKVGASSTAQAIQLAYLWGTKRIALLGVDCQGTHWFGDHPPILKEPLPYRRWINELSFMAPQLEAAGVTVINCSRETVLTCFVRMPLATFLPSSM